MKSFKRSHDLIFFYSHENCPARATAMPVLAWLAEEKGLDYDGYFAVKPSVADIGDALPFTGNKHDQQFYYLTNFYQHIYFFALTEEEPIQFERFLRARGNCTIIKKSSNELCSFFREIFDLFEQPFPEQAVVFPSKKFSFPNEKVQIGDFKIEGETRLDTFCYPEIFYRKALAFHTEISDDQLAKFQKAGVEQLHFIFGNEADRDKLKKIKFTVNEIDYVKPDDNYRSITERVARRWIDRASGLALGNDPITLKWTPKYLRDRILTIAAVASLLEAVDVLGELSDRIGNKLIWGSQVFNDTIISDAAKHDLVFSLVHDVEVGITIKDKIQQPNLWLKNSAAPWEKEYDDEFLNQQIEQRKIPVCFLHYASDLGHLPILPRLLDLHSIDGFSAGLAFPSNWWEFAEEQVEQLYLSKEMGGIFPTCEPLMCSAGIGVTTEAKGYCSPDALLKYLKQAKEIIKKRAGKKHIPIGHYSFTDACPRYQHNTAEPQFNVLKQAGFEYAISYKNEGEMSQILYSDKEFIVLNQQNEHWTFDPMKDLLGWEQELAAQEKPGWIMLGLDSPFWGFVPCYFGLASKGLDLTKLQQAMTYARDGGKSGQLYLAKPHEVVRIARMMNEKVLI